MALDTAAWVAIFFLLFGLFLILVEVLNPGFFIAVPGGAMAIMGGIGLVAPHLMYGTSYAWFMWPLAGAVATAANIYVYKKWAPAGDRPLTSSQDSLPGKVGRVDSEVVPVGSSGKVVIEGATWSARVPDGARSIPAGRKVRVLRTEGVHLIVEEA